MAEWPDEGEDHDRQRQRTVLVGGHSGSHILGGDVWDSTGGGSFSHHIETRSGGISSRL